MTSLLFLLEGCSIREGRRDARVWHPNPSRGFSCNSLFSLLLDLVPPKESIFDVVWRTKVPKKVRFFIWQVLLDWINIVDRLVRRRTSLVGPFCCMLCWMAEEDLDHLIWDCQFVRAVWCSFL